MGKKRSAAMVILLACTCLWLLPAARIKADMGPKPSVVVDFPHADGRTFYVTLLSKTASTGPYSTYRESSPPLLYEDEPAMQAAYQKFLDYEDRDGFYFLQYFADCTESGEFSWTYYPPRVYKILVYLPEQNGSAEEFLSSEILEAYAFDSYYTVNSSNGALAVRQSYNYIPELLSLLVRVVLTILIELALAWVFGFRQKAVLRFILYLNLITQIGLNVALNISAYLGGSLAFMFFFVLLEMAVFIVEAVVYARSLPRRSQGEIKRGTAVAYALAANAVSVAAGWLLARHLPGIF